MTNTATDVPQHKPHPRDYDSQLAPFRNSSTLRSLGQLGFTLLLLALCFAAMLYCLSISYGLVLLLAVPTACLFVRLFIFQHDCGHGSYFPSRRMNDVTGTLLGMLTLTPYRAWRREHAQHHAGSGNLDSEHGVGEIWTMTVREYQQASWKKRLAYRWYRHPLVMFFFGPVYYFVIQQRFASLLPKTWKHERRGVHVTNIGLAAVWTVMSCLVGPAEFFLVYTPAMWLAASIGVWMFYVQHQFEEAYWERQPRWNFVAAALRGSSYYRLPKLLHWLTGNIGYHHIHHLDSRIPNYRLRACHERNAKLFAVPSLSIWQSLCCVRLKLWDEQRKCMVGLPKPGSRPALSADRRLGDHPHAGMRYDGPAARTDSDATSA